MSEETSFTTEELLNAARGNLNFMAFVTICYLKEHNLSLGEYQDFVGRKAAPGWKMDRTAKQFVQGIARNIASFGAEIRSISASESQAEIVIANWPDTYWLESFDLTQEEADSFFDNGKPIAEHLGFSFEWVRRGAEVTITISR